MVKPEVAKRLLALHGTLRPQPPSDWSGPFPLPPDIEEFYREVGPSDISIRDHGNPYFLPRLAHLWRFQAGYRWDGISGEGVDDWSDNWFMVVAQGGDPFIYERTSGVVLHAFCGEGHWDPKEVFPDLVSMAACLAQIGAMVAEAGVSYMHEDFSVRPEFRKLVSARLQELPGS
jgi:hypothetical protein